LTWSIPVYNANGEAGIQLKLLAAGASDNEERHRRRVQADCNWGILRRGG
jgi:hypothetical protein